MKTILMKQEGPLIQFDGEFIHIEDLNPHVHTKWRMSRFEMIVLGAKTILSALSHSDGNQEGIGK